MFIDRDRVFAEMLRFDEQQIPLIDNRLLRDY